MSTRPIWAVVPVKAPNLAKTRLSSVLDAAQRAEIAIAMMEDVLDTLVGSACLDGVIVVTSDPQVALIAERHSAQVLFETGSGLNEAIRQAALWLAERGCAMAVIPADVPLLLPSDIARLAASGAHFAIARSDDGEGTNGLFVSPAHRVAPMFGPGSFQLHCDQAAELGLPVRIVESETLALDIDTPADLGQLSLHADDTRSRWRARDWAAGRAADTAMAEFALPYALADGDPYAMLEQPLDTLMACAARLRDQGHGRRISYSRKIFIPLTQLCRDSCHYCTFAKAPSRMTRAYLTPDEVLAIAKAGAAAGCREALFTLGDKPELRYRVARDALTALGHETTLSYVAEMAGLVHRETGLLPHINAGVMDRADLEKLRVVSASQGLMLESAATRLCERGGPHFGSPDKDPTARLATIARAGEAGIPFTSGVLVGIGETRRERIDALLALRELHRRYGHIQEIIVQNFRAKPDTGMAGHTEPSLAEHLWSIAVARILFGAQMNIQAPPNLSPDSLPQLIAAGINDWGGVSPVTPDHVNPERPWPEISRLTAATEATGRALVQRLTVYPSYAKAPERWLDPALHSSVRRATDSEGYAREDGWLAGAGIAPPALGRTDASCARSSLHAIIDRAMAGEPLDENDITSLFGARGADVARVCEAADRLGRTTHNDRVSYVVTRNINYTNICIYKCAFCSFSKGKTNEHLRGRPYNLDLGAIVARAEQAWDRGAVEVCLQGGIHPDYTGRTYLAILRAIKDRLPDLHVHAFSPLEVSQGAATLGMPAHHYLAELKAAGLGSLPGTAAEILDDEVRRIICPDKLSTNEWLHVVGAAHDVGLRTTATIMFGHVDAPHHWARHLMRIRSLQMKTGGFTEFVPLPFVAAETPLNLKGRSRLGPTFREAVLMHAIARLVLHPHIVNIQASWVKMGPLGLEACLAAGVNDIGGTLMDESITRAAGAVHGQEMTPAAMEDIIRRAGRSPWQRTTLYAPAPPEREVASFGAIAPQLASSTDHDMVLAEQPGR